MSVAAAFDEQAVFTAMRAFLLGVLPSGVEVIKSQQNRVSMPPGPFVTMTRSAIKRMSTNVATYDYANSKTVAADTQYGMQLDFYGAGAATNATTVQTLFRDQYAVDAFPDAVQPLYADDAVQLPMVTGEEQYEQRWKIEAQLQVKAPVTVTQEFADELQIGLIPVDVLYPPA